MHIISGKYQRRSLKFPRDRSFRPTKSIVRESVFNIIGNKIQHASFLDLCSGSGAMGLEAESRGASTVICVDRYVKFLMHNKESMGAGIDIVRQDIVRFLNATALTFDFIFLDPIWADKDTYTVSIRTIFNRSLLNANGWLFVEHDETFRLADLFEVSKQYKYGNSRLSVCIQA
jgi:16S rRNA (guanine966-N2)-methyltransferase